MDINVSIYTFLIKVFSHCRENHTLIVVKVLDPEIKRSIGIQTDSVLRPKLSKDMKTHVNKRIQTNMPNFGLPLKKRRRFSSEEKKNAIREVYHKMIFHDMQICYLIAITTKFLHVHLCSVNHHNTHSCCGKSINTNIIVFTIKQF